MDFYPQSAKWMWTGVPESGTRKRKLGSYAVGGARAGSRRITGADASPVSRGSGAGARTAITGAGSIASGRSIGWWLRWQMQQFVSEESAA